MATNSYAHRVAGNVRAELARGGVSQSVLARKLQRTQQYVSRRLVGNVPFNVDELDQIAQVLGIPVDAFLRVPEMTR